MRDKQEAYLTLKGHKVSVYR